MLPSGLPKNLSNDEEIARFIFQSNNFSRNPLKAKHRLFHPMLNEEKSRWETSVSRIAGDLNTNVHSRGSQVAASIQKNYYGFARFSVLLARNLNLTVNSDEPPDKHAILTEWPNDDDIEIRKAKLIDIAEGLADEAIVIFS